MARRSVMSWLGLGSVGDYCVHNLHTPVAVIRKQEHEAEELLHNPEVCLAIITMNGVPCQALTLLQMDEALVPRQGQQYFVALWLLRECGREYGEGASEPQVRGL